MHAIWALGYVPTDVCANYLEGSNNGVPLWDIGRKVWRSLWSWQNSCHLGVGVAHIRLNGIREYCGILGSYLSKDGTNCMLKSAAPSNKRLPELAESEVPGFWCISTNRNQIQTVGLLERHWDAGKQRTAPPDSPCECGSFSFLDNCFLRCRSLVPLIDVFRRPLISVYVTWIKLSQVNQHLIMACMRFTRRVNPARASVILSAS